jgi:hypothetical protein
METEIDLYYNDDVTKLIIMELCDMPNIFITRCDLFILKKKNHIIIWIMLPFWGVVANSL